MPVTQSDAIQASAVFRLNSITLRRSTSLGFDIRTSWKHESAAESICNRRTGGADDDNLDHTKLFTTQGGTLGCGNENVSQCDQLQNIESLC